MGAVVCGLEALACAGAVVVYIVGLAAGRADDAVVAVSSMLLLVLFTLALAAMAVRWWQGSEWPRTPTLVANALLLPVAWTVAQTSGLAIGVPIALVAVTGIAAALLDRDPVA